jgi:hypothetical protein
MEATIEKKITPRELEAEAQRLIAAGDMPGLEELLTVIGEIREKYRLKILDARAMGDNGAGFGAEGET